MVDVSFCFLTLRSTAQCVALCLDVIQTQRQRERHDYFLFHLGLALLVFITTTLSPFNTDPNTEHGSRRCRKQTSIIYRPLRTVELICNLLSNTILNEFLNINVSHDDQRRRLTCLTSAALTKHAAQIQTMTLIWCESSSKISKEKNTNTSTCRSEVSNSFRFMVQSHKMSSGPDYVP